MTRYGRNVGLAFQIVDDILDITASSERLGKTAGKDQKVKKATYPALYGLEASRRRRANWSRLRSKTFSDFGAPAGPLRTIARFILSRTT